MVTRRRGRLALAGLTVAAAVTVAASGHSMATAAETSPPVIAPATFSAPPDGNSNWRLTKPQTLTLSATDDVAVAKFQYSLDGGATYVDVPVTPGPSATAQRVAVAGGQHDGALPRRGQLGQLLARRDHEHDLEPAVGRRRDGRPPHEHDRPQRGRRARDRHGRAAGDGDDRDDRDAGSRPSPAPNVTLTAPLANAHAAGAAVAGTAFFNTIALLIDTKGPVATWATQATTLQATSATAGAPAAAPGDTQVRLASLTGRAAGDTLQIDQGPNAETVKIASVVDPAPAAPAANVVLDERAGEDAPRRRRGLRAVDRGRQDPPVADADPAADRSAPARRERHRRQRRRRRGAPADDARRRVHDPEDAAAQPAHGRQAHPDRGAPGRRRTARSSTRTRSW